jgi:hypothetical protein
MVLSASHRLASIVITTSSCATIPTIFHGKQWPARTRSSRFINKCRSGRALIESVRRCECDNLPQLQPLFQRINSGTKDEVAAAINMTSVFVYQASVALVKNSESATCSTSVCDSCTRRRSMLQQLLDFSGLLFCTKITC